MIFEIWFNRILITLFVIISLTACQEVNSPQIEVKAFSLEEAVINKDKITFLSLRDKGYENIPSDIFQMKNLEVLDLSLNKLTSIPKEIRSLQKLKYLSLSYNEISSMPISLSDLKRLEVLMLLDNKISIIPESICALINLQELNLAENSISSIPHCIVKLKDLRKLAVVSDNEYSLISVQEQVIINKLLPNCSIAF